MLKSLKRTHEHTWQEILASRWGKVERCTECRQYQTTMLDYTTQELATVPGNFLAAISAKIYVICGSQEEYTDIATQLKAADFPEERLIKLDSVEQIEGWTGPVPIIYFWGTWWENELCQSEAFRKALNGWL